jgi:hypothetical protein
MVLRALLGFLVLTALVAIVDVWTDVDEDAKVLMSCLVLTVASVITLPGAARLDQDKTSPTGLGTFVLTSVAAFTTLWLLWFEPKDPTLLGQVVLSSWLWSLTVSLHAWVMVAVLPDRATWLKIAAPALTYLAGVLATLSIFEVLVFEEGVRYTTATIYILAGLANLAVLIVHLMVRSERIIEA